MEIRSNNCTKCDFGAVSSKKDSYEYDPEEGGNFGAVHDPQVRVLRSYALSEEKTKFQWLGATSLMFPECTL